MAVSQVRQTGRAVARLCDKMATACGDVDRHVGIYASLDNWCTCFEYV